MLASSELNELLKISLKSVENHPYHDLNLGYRHNIWMYFGPRIEGFGLKDIGRKKRAMLAITAVKYVLPIYENLCSDSKLPHQTLTVAESVLNGITNPQDADTFCGDLWDTLDIMADKPEDQVKYQEHKHFRIFSVCNAAYKALRTCLYDETFDSNTINHNFTDDKVDYHSDDASFWAAKAYAGPIWKAVAYGSPRQESEFSDSNRRHVFWKWWLLEAVPSIFQTY
jgi:Immunity protein Imm5